MIFFKLLCQLYDQSDIENLLAWSGVRYVWWTFHEKTACQTYFFRIRSPKKRSDHES